MPEPQILCIMCDNSVNKAVHGLAAILLVHLVGQPPKNVKNEICPHRCFSFYTRTARLKSPKRKIFSTQELYFDAIDFCAKKPVCLLIVRY